MIEMSFLCFQVFSKQGRKFKQVNIQTSGLMWPRTGSTDGPLLTLSSMFDCMRVTSYEHLIVQKNLRPCHR